MLNFLHDALPEFISGNSSAVNSVLPWLTFIKSGLADLFSAIMSRAVFMNQKHASWQASLNFRPYIYKIQIVQCCLDCNSGF